MHPRTNPNDIGIYRSYHPYINFIELGLISLNTASLDLHWIYEHLRADAAEVGAEAIELFRSTAPTKKYVEIGAVNACCSGDALIGLEVSARGAATASVIRFEP